ncbi:hypothetical protein F2Q70_00029668 [Brassica cretica]|uniref:Uncharacterized protein n=1 Tax=Brassica cretica TaxID=69181 RepID=A0A8S9FGA5_BRACR|nr:hypothetical protein F2Q70_00029668 [Brassica cretica]
MAGGEVSLASVAFLLFFFSLSLSFSLWRKATSLAIGGSLRRNGGVSLGGCRRRTTSPLSVALLHQGNRRDLFLFLSSPRRKARSLPIGCLIKMLDPGDISCDRWLSSTKWRRLSRQLSKANDVPFICCSPPPRKTARSLSLSFLSSAKGEISPDRWLCSTIRPRLCRWLSLRKGNGAFSLCFFPLLGEKRLSLSLKRC